jgi:hypothetical protein
MKIPAFRLAACLLGEQGSHGPAADIRQQERKAGRKTEDDAWDLGGRVGRVKPETRLAPRTLKKTLHRSHASQGG